MNKKRKKFPSREKETLQSKLQTESFVNSTKITFY